MMINDLFFEERTIEIGGDGGPWARLVIRAFRVCDRGPILVHGEQHWLDWVSLSVNAVDGIGRVNDLTRDAQDYLVLNRPLEQIIDERVCFSDERGTWAEIVGATCDAQAIRKTIAKLDKTWEICQPILKKFLAEYTPDEGAPAS